MKNMLIGINTPSINGKDMFEQIDWIKNAKFEAIEIECTPSPKFSHGLWTRYADDQTIAKMKAAVAGFKELSFHAPYSFFDVSIISPNPFVRKVSIDEICFVMDFAGKMGGKMITVHSGIPTYGMTEEENFEILRESLKILSDEAKKRDVLIGVEVVDFFYCPSRFSVVEELNLENVGITIDIGHLCFPQPNLNNQPGYTEFGSIEGVFKRFAERIWHVHIHDFNIKDHQALGDGHLDFKSIIKTLKEIKYERTLTLELTTKVPEEKILSSKKYLEELIAF
ncbi:MAG: sugar phosphate isomerase/epimerase [Verrucomicrobiae bacterium]|nr:sugar phosphate isomerase/epimerase [Verrucomicrobiae bacterium]